MALVTRAGLRLVVLVTLLAITGCSTSSSPGTSGSGSTGSKALSPTTAVGATPAGSGMKVLVIPEENKPYADVIGHPDAPYLNQLAATYGSATQMDAGYPVQCPSLAAYILLTSGDRHGICDDKNPRAHPLNGDNLFSQVAASGRQWRVYAESMPAPCTATNSKDGLYLVRHTAAPYYLTETTSGRCNRWQVPAGDHSAGALHDALVAGALPSFSLVVPNACNDMHGAAGCPDRLVQRGDTWLSTWLPEVLAGPDFTSGHLVVLITWDEGSRTDNHIPTLVIAPTVRSRTVGSPYTHCASLRTVQDLLGLKALGCAATATSMVVPFGLSAK